jgi:type I restriction enzyme, R subunit
VTWSRGRPEHLAACDCTRGQQTRRGVHSIIQFALNELPEEPYPEAMWQTKVDAVWAYIFSRTQQRRTDALSCC